VLLMTSPEHSVTLNVVGLDGQPTHFDRLRVLTSSPRTEAGMTLWSLAESNYVEANAGTYKFQYRLKDPAASVWVEIERDEHQSMQLIRPGLHEYNFRFEDKSPDGTQKLSKESVRPKQPDGIASYRYDLDTGLADIGIITMKPEEIGAVLKRFPSNRTEDGVNLRYNLCDFADSSGKQLTAAIVQSPQGDVSAFGTAMDLIREVRPRLVVLVGIAGGRPAGEFTLGDVVVANKMVNLTVSAASPGALDYATGTSDLHRDVGIVVSNLVGDARHYMGWSSAASIGKRRPSVSLALRNFKGPEDWKKKTRQALGKYFGNKGKNRRPIVIAGPIASGSMLMKDPEIFARWQKASRDIMAVDMEIVGVFEACRRAEKLVPTLVIRGISDVIGFSRDDNWTEYACETAAAFTKSLLTARTIPLLC
jgi:nucleoside phosphorylase